MRSYGSKILSLTVYLFARFYVLDMSIIKFQEFETLFTIDLVDYLRMFASTLSGMFRFSLFEPLYGCFIIASIAQIYRLCIDTQQALSFNSKKS